MSINIISLSIGVAIGMIIELLLMLFINGVGGGDER